MQQELKKLLSSDNKEKKKERKVPYLCPVSEMCLIPVGNSHKEKWMNANLTEVSKPFVWTPKIFDLADQKYLVFYLILAPRCRATDFFLHQDNHCSSLSLCRCASWFTWGIQGSHTTVAHKISWFLQGTRANFQDNFFVTSNFFSSFFFFVETSRFFRFVFLTQKVKIFPSNKAKRKLFLS